MSPAIEPLLLTTARVSTYFGTQLLTGATGFFFERDARLFFVTSRHVVVDAPSGHFPDRIEIELHTDEDNLARSAVLSVLLYRDGMSVWHQGRDAGGEIDVAVIEIERAALPQTVLMRCFTPTHLQDSLQEVEVGSSLLVVGFPLGFHDTLHHLPVVRQALIASSFGLRFQGQGYFLTDARTHRGTSGAPVVMRDAAPATRSCRGSCSACIRAHGHAQPRPAARRIAGPELRLVCRHPADADDRRFTHSDAGAVAQLTAIAWRGRGSRARAPVNFRVRLARRRTCARARHPWPVAGPQQHPGLSALP